MSAIDAALRQIDGVAADGDLAPSPPGALRAVDPADASEPVELPDARTLYVARLRGRRVDTLACAPLDLERPGRARSSCASPLGPAQATGQAGRWPGRA